MEEDVAIQRQEGREGACPHEPTMACVIVIQSVSEHQILHTPSEVMKQIVFYIPYSYGGVNGANTPLTLAKLRMSLSWMEG